jgi:HAD superfamily hydrolase (TIGR01549 family)|tara:strand:+ start:208 stop:705 length:498 start_codon:yes stop_codon:yes gene_type:complete
MRFEGIIFDLDLTLVDSSILFELRERRLWSEVYKNIPKTTVYDGVHELIDELKPLYELGIVTSSPRTYAERLTSFHGIEIPILTTYHDTRLHKPDPAPIIHGCKKLKLSPSQVISIGDDIKDIEASNRAGCTSIFASWRSSSDFHPSADYNCSSVARLKQFLIQK